MSTLTISFRYMMLFLRTDAGMDVLMPADGHTGTIAQPGTGRSVALSPGSRIWMTADGKPSAGTVAFSRRDRIDELPKIVGVRRLLKAYGVSSFVERRYLRGGPVPTTLNARVEINGGLLQAVACECAKSKVAALADYYFPQVDYWNHRLTDQALYTLTLSPSVQYLVHVELPDRPAGDQPAPFDLASGTHLEIQNADRPDNPSGVGIVELESVYALYKPPLGSLGVETPVMVPDPRAGLASPEAPQCPPMEDCEECGTEDPDCECEG